MASFLTENLEKTQTTQDHILDGRNLRSLKRVLVLQTLIIHYLWKIINYCVKAKKL